MFLSNKIFCFSPYLLSFSLWKTITCIAGDETEELYSLKMKTLIDLDESINNDVIEYDSRQSKFQSENLSRCLKWKKWHLAQLMPFFACRSALRKRTPSSPTSLMSWLCTKRTPTRETAPPGSTWCAAICTKLSRTSPSTWSLTWQRFVRWWCI